MIHGNEIYPQMQDLVYIIIFNISLEMNFMTDARGPSQ